MIEFDDDNYQIGFQLQSDLKSDDESDFRLKARVILSPKLENVTAIRMCHFRK